jgi:lipopolysaccharide/colanic/teichoic acid biosynthesis glycosyltransferase
MPVDGKRVFDLLLSSMALVLLSPVVGALAIAALASSGTPILFCQLRLGRNRQPFTLLKFRTMRPASEARSGGFTPGDRSRVTGFGRFLRRTKLDELPQLWNVLRGDMSLVGPRPEVPKWTEVYSDRWDKVLAVRPGITDPASIAFRDEESLLAAAPDPERLYREVILPRKLSMYERYIAERSTMRDAIILAKTVWAVLAPRTKA